MGALRLLPGEKEELRLRPAWGSLWPQRLASLAFLLPAVLLALVFHSPWWTGHRPSDWTAAWTWLWGNDGAAYAWTLLLLTAGGAVSGLRARRLLRRRTATGAAIGAAACLAAAATPLASTLALPLTVAAAGILVLVWVEAVRLTTSYHVTNLRLVERRLLPRRLERDVLYADLVDLDAAPSALRDTGTLIPVLAPRRDGEGDGRRLEPRAQPPRLSGIRPFARVRHLVELLARRATASERVKAETRVDDDVAEALAGLHRRA